MSKRQLARVTLDDLLDHRPDLVLEILEARLDDDPRIAELLGNDCPWTEDAEDDEPAKSRPTEPNPRTLPKFEGPQILAHRWQSIQKLVCPWPWQVEFSELAWRKHWAYAWADPDTEISGFGLLEYDGPPVPNQHWKATVVDFWYLSSFDTSTRSVIPAEAQAQLQMRLLQEKRDLNKLRLWWHSHHHMSAFWSPTDVRAIGEMMDAQAIVSGQESGWMISSVCAFPRNLLVRVDFWHKAGPHLDGICIDQVPVYGPDGVQLTEIACFEEVSQRRSTWSPFRVGDELKPREIPRVGSSGTAIQPALLPGFAPLAEAARRDGEASCTHSRRQECSLCWTDCYGRD